MTKREGTEVYFNDQYFYAFYSNKNIDIYSTKLVNLAQILDVSDYDVISLKSSFIRPAIFVLTRSCVLVFSPYYSIYGTINFSRVFKQNISNEFSSIEVSMTGNYFILTNKGDCSIFRVGWGFSSVEDPQTIENVSKISTVRFPENIEKNSLSNGMMRVTV